MDADIKLIKADSSEYREELELRNEVLRKPLGLNLYEEDLSQEWEQYHIGLFDSGRLLGVLILVPLGTDFRMRQFAVTADSRGMGVGRRLILFAEKFVREKGGTRIWFHARKTAVPFYEKQGYKTVGAPFVELSVPHIEMEKELVSAGK